MSDRPESRQSTQLLTLVGTVGILGAFVIGHSIFLLVQAPVSGYAVLLALATIAAGRYGIKMPGYSARVSVSELFVFASALLFGPALATISVAVDGVSASMAQRNRRWYRTLFNIAEPAVSMWTAGQVFYLIIGTPPSSEADLRLSDLLLPTVAMGSVYFVLNSVLTAAAIAFESRSSVYAVWRQHAFYLGVNYYAAACLAALAVKTPGGMTLAMIGFGAPLLILSYVAYETASRRITEAEKHVRDIEQLYHATVEALATAVDVKDQVTHGHIRRVQRHTTAVARAMGLVDAAEIKAIDAAALLHDIGKLAIPDHVLYKPGPLTTDEFECMKLHAKMGATILSSVEFSCPVVPIVRHHHERWDGTGYPDGLAGTSIPIGARILTVVDCFDAVTSDRPYRAALSVADATALLQAGRGTQYDPAVVDAFVALIPELRRGDEDTAAHIAAADALINGVGDVWHRASTVTPEQAPITMARLRENAAEALYRIHNLRPGLEACIFGVDATDQLSVVAATDRIHTTAAGRGPRLGQGLSGWVAAYRHPIFNSDPRLDFGGVACEALGLRSSASLPIFGFGTLVGVLTVYASEPKAFCAEDVCLLTNLAENLAAEPQPAMRPVART